MAPAEITPGRSIEPARAPSGSKWLALGIGLAVLVVAGGLITWIVGAQQRDIRVDAVAAWRAGNAAWARGDIAAVCDTYDGIGTDGMWKDRATCMSSENKGYQEASTEQKAALAALTVDPTRTELLGTDTVVIWFRDARVDGRPPEYFGPSDLAVMSLTGGSWRQIGARYSGAIVGSVPSAVVPAPTGSPGSSPPALTDLPLSSQSTA
ncbi:MAG: nuclear transport factor 2 family protein [Kineosporiaceae bacterium]